MLSGRTEHESRHEMATEEPNAILASHFRKDSFQKYATKMFNGEKIPTFEQRCKPKEPNASWSFTIFQKYA